MREGRGNVEYEDTRERMYAARELSTSTRRPCVPLYRWQRAADVRDQGRGAPRRAARRTRLVDEHRLPDLPVMKREIPPGGERRALLTPDMRPNLFPRDPCYSENARNNARDFPSPALYRGHFEPRAAGPRAPNAPSCTIGDFTRRKCERSRWDNVRLRRGRRARGAPSRAPRSRGWIEFGKRADCIEARLYLYQIARPYLRVKPDVTGGRPSWPPQSFLLFNNIA